MNFRKSLFSVANMFAFAGKGENDGGIGGFDGGDLTKKQRREKAKCKEQRLARRKNRRKQ